MYKSCRGEGRGCPVVFRTLDHAHACRYAKGALKRTVRNNHSFMVVVYCTFSKPLKCLMSEIAREYEGSYFAHLRQFKLIRLRFHCNTGDTRQRDSRTAWGGPFSFLAFCSLWKACWCFLRSCFYQILRLSALQHSSVTSTESSVFQERRWESYHFVLFAIRDVWCKWLAPLFPSERLRVCSRQPTTFALSAQPLPLGVVDLKHPPPPPEFLVTFNFFAPWYRKL